MFLAEYMVKYPRQDIDWQEVHRVHGEYPHENGQRCRGYKFMAITVEGAFDLVIDKLE